MKLLILSTSIMAGIPFLCSCTEEVVISSTEEVVITSTEEVITTGNNIFYGGLQVQQTCTISETDFAAWFANNTITVNGKVESANSLETLNNPCDFYKWSWQMFLWQTSPNGNGLVFTTAPFYDLALDGELISNPPTVGKTALGRISGINSSTGTENMDRNGQAGFLHGVLMTQDVGITPSGSLVYYGVHVNDVYAYMKSGNKQGSLDLTEFPTTQSQLTEITNYAQSTYDTSIEDSQALTMELKSSWVEADPNSKGIENYLTITADIPKYDQTNSGKWTWDGSTMKENVTLALIGYHVVGSVAGHPEMVWATFEHNGNAPNADFYYLDTNGNTKKTNSWNADGTSKIQDTLLMSNTGTQQATNQMHMEMQGNDIVATNGFTTISASDSSRTHPWGNKPDQSSAVNNTAIISLNQSIQGWLDPKDTRRNYFLVGANWTSNGIPGVGKQEPVVEGSKHLANSSMETYYQFKNCFDCHKDGKLDGLSHIYESVNPLPLPKK